MKSEWVLEQRFLPSDPWEQSDSGCYAPTFRERQAELQLLADQWKPQLPEFAYRWRNRITNDVEYLVDPYEMVELLQQKLQQSQATLTKYEKILTDIIAAGASRVLGVAVTSIPAQVFEESISELKKCFASDKLHITQPEEVR